MRQPPAYTFWLCLLAFGLLLLVSNHSTLLWDQDEAAYAGMARNMVESGDWLTQEFIWSEIHRKPPWHLWAVAASFQAFGPNEFALRLPGSLALLGVFCLLWWAFPKNWRHLGPWAAMIFAASFFAPILGKIALTDGWLLLWETICLIALWRLFTDEKAGWWIAYFWIGIAMGVLTKGPSILLSVGIACFMLLVMHPQRRRIWRLHPWFGLPLALVPLLLWGYFSWQRDDGQMINWMLDWYILKRTGGTVLGQSGPPGYYAATLLVAFLPFAQRLIPAIGRWIKEIRQKQPDALFWLSWLIGSWLLWELIPSKLPAYAIGAHPAIAILLAQQLSVPRSGRPQQKAGLILQTTLTLALVVVLCGGSIYLWQWSGIGWVLLASVAILLALLAPQIWDHPLGSRLQIGGAMGFMLILWLGLMPKVDALREAPIKVHQYLQNFSPEQTTIVLANVQGRPPSLPFYLGQTFDRFLEERDPQTLAALYVSKRPMAFLLTDAQYEQMRQFEPNLAKPAVFDLFSSDRIEGNAYYVLLNDAAKTANRK
ncbi:MAG: glycosyltransferase family 39 protein [Bacteroidota bacterium]